MRWYTSYPWIVDPKLLPNNYAGAFATLKNTEKQLLKDPGWAATYKAQIQDLIDRGVARVLTDQEMSNWDGPVFYISHMCVEQPWSESTPVRVVWNSSQIFKGISLNSFLAKGPDSQGATLLGLLIRDREGPVLIIGDITKMYNSTHLTPIEVHVHRFLWRDLDTSRAPDTLAMLRVNIGDKPAGAISVAALQMTANMYQHISPAAADMLTRSTYIDDIQHTASTYSEAKALTSDADKILDKGGFLIKHWIYSGKDVPCDDPNDKTEILGINLWRYNDTISFTAKLNFSPKRRKLRTGPDLKPCNIPQGIPQVLTRRLVLEQVMSVFEPYGFFGPFMLRAKLLLRESWQLELDWDGALPSTLHTRWEGWFSQLLEINDLKFERCVKPEGAVGNPGLVLLSDGSELAYGAVCYIRWKLADGTYWCRLVFAKCRIAPLNRISIVDMELNGSVLSKRIRKVFEKESNFTFDYVIHIVDSETVLCMLKKLSTRFQVYQGVRIGEIQAATNGDMSCWYWIPGIKNIADWITRPDHTPSDLGPSSTWFNGPAFMYLPFEQWDVKSDPRHPGPLPGEKKPATSKVKVNHVSLVVRNSYDRVSRVEILRLCTCNQHTEKQNFCRWQSLQYRTCSDCRS